jgi:tryptophan halogenase
MKPYTRAIAMKYGWMWQIPLQNRWGCGYIFDDNYIDYEKAKQEVEEHLGHSIEINKLIKFRAGRFLNTWVNNVIAIGLSGGFTEPLEATSIMVAIAGLKDLSKTVLDNYNEKVIKEYNDFMGSYNDEIVDFLQFHYITKRTDTPFWKYYTEKSPLSDSLRNIVESYFNGKFFEIDEKDKIVFAESNYMEVGYGLEFFDSDYFKRIYQQYEDKGVIQKIHEHNSESLKYSYDNSIPALDFIKLVKIAYDDNQLDDFKKLLKKDEPKEKEKSKSWKLW